MNNDADRLCTQLLPTTGCSVFPDDAELHGAVSLGVCGGMYVTEVALLQGHHTWWKTGLRFQEKKKKEINDAHQQVYSIVECFNTIPRGKDKSNDLREATLSVSPLCRTDHRPRLPYFYNILYFRIFFIFIALP